MDDTFDLKHFYLLFVTTVNNEILFEILYRKRQLVYKRHWNAANSNFKETCLYNINLNFKNLISSNLNVRREKSHGVAIWTVL